MATPGLIFTNLSWYMGPQNKLRRSRRGEKKSFQQKIKPFQSEGVSPQSLGMESCGAHTPRTLSIGRHAEYYTYKSEVYNLSFQEKTEFFLLLAANKLKPPS